MLNEYNIRLIERKMGPGDGESFSDFIERRVSDHSKRRRELNIFRDLEILIGSFWDTSFTTFEQLSESVNKNAYKELMEIISSDLEFRRKSRIAEFEPKSVREMMLETTLEALRLAQLAHLKY